MSKNNSPEQDFINPEAIVILNSINEHISTHGSGEILTKSDRLNKEGKEISTNIYNDFLEKTHGNFAEMLNICKDAESMLRGDDENNPHFENLKIIQSVRGKIVYNAHINWAEQHGRKFDTESSRIASNVFQHTRWGKELADAHGEKVDVYGIAAKEKLATEKILDKSVNTLNVENERILLPDVSKAMEGAPESEIQHIFIELKKALSEIKNSIVNASLRRKILSLTSVTALSSIGISLAMGAGQIENQGKKGESVANRGGESRLSLDKTPDMMNSLDKTSETFKKYLASDKEIPDGLTTEPGKGIDRIYANDEIVDRVLSGIQNESENFSTSSGLELPKNYEIPQNELKSLESSGILAINETLKVRDGDTMKSFLAFQEAANEQLEKEGKNQVVIAVRATQTRAQQQKVYDDWVKEHGNDEGVAKPGQSIFETGRAIHWMLVEKPEKGEDPDLNTLKQIPTRIMKLAEETGLGVPSIEVRGIMISLEGISEGLSDKLEQAGINTVPESVADKAFSHTIKIVLNELAKQEMVAQ